MALREALRVKPIEIAFPRQDLRLRTVSAEASTAPPDGDRI